MAGQDYLIPFGIDSDPFLKGLNEMDAGVDKLTLNITDANKQMQTAFNTSATAGETLGKKLDVDAQKVKTLADTAKNLGRDLGTALNGNNVGAGLETRLDKIKKLMTGAGGKGVKLGFDIDTKKLEEFEKMIIEGKDEIQVLSAVVDHAKQKLSELAPDSAEFKELSQEINTSEQFLQNFAETADVAEKKNGSLKSQLRQLKEELAKMETQGQENTQEFLDMSIAAGKVEDQIGDISARVRVLASDTKYIDAGIQAVTGLAGAFAAAQGAAALFGSENEEINEVIQKTTGAMAILQGIQAVSIALNKDSALSVLFLSRATTQNTAATIAQTGATVATTGATVAATGATRGFTAALLANPITLVVVALVAAVTALLAFTSGSDDAEEAAADLNRTLERQNTLLKLDEGNINRRTNLLIAQAKKQGKAESEITQIEREQLRDRINLRAENLEETRKLLRNQKFMESLSAEDFKKLQDTELEQYIDYLDLRNELDVKSIEQETQRDKERKDRSKKAIEDAQKSAQQQKEILEQQIKFRREFSAAYIDSIIDQYEKEKETLRVNTAQKIEDLQREKSLSGKAEKEKNDVITQLRKNLTAQLKEIDRKMEADRAALLFEGRNKLAELQAEGTAKELELLQLSYETRAREINEQFKNEGELRVKLLAALSAQKTAEEKKVNDAAASEALKQAEERAVLEVETAAKFVGELPKLEEQKQIEILKVKIDFAEQSLNLLLSQGNAENSIAVLQAKKNVQDLKKALGIAVKESSQEKEFSLFDVLGLGELTDTERDAVVKAARTSLDAVKGITDFIVSQYERQIDAKQKVIDQENDDIKNLEDQLEEEKDLREQGFANNVDLLQAELDAKKAQRDEDIKQQEELQKKQAAIQKMQIAIDTATQASGLITSAANIFKSLSPLGPIGVGLAITTIALMAGAFVAARAKAFQAVNDAQKFGMGGTIEDGKPHSRGGKKYFAADGSGDVLELESGEKVTRRVMSDKYGDLLDAINDDRLAGMSEEALRDMLASMGIHLTEENTRESLTIVQERDNLKREIMLLPGVDISGDVKSINQGVSYLAEQERITPKTWTENGYLCTKIGLKIKRKKIQ